MGLDAFVGVGTKDNNLDRTDISTSLFMHTLWLRVITFPVYGKDLQRRVCGEHLQRLKDWEHIGILWPFSERDIIYISIMSKALNSNGLFGYHKLMDWYYTEFDDSEREGFRDAYGNARMGIPFERLINGDEVPLMKGLNKEAGAVDLLTSVLHKILFRSNYPVKLAEKIIEKIRTLMNADTDVIESYFAYLQLIDFYKCQMERSSLYEQSFVQSCLSMIAIAKEARKAFQDEGGRLPNHTGFIELSDYYQHKKMFKEAAWVEEQSIKLWGVSVGIDYESWVEHLIECGAKVEAKRVLDLLIEETGDEVYWQIYKKKIDALPEVA